MSSHCFRGAGVRTCSPFFSGVCLRMSVIISIFAFLILSTLIEDIFSGSFSALKLQMRYITFPCLYIGRIWEIIREKEDEIYKKERHFSI